LKVLAPGEVAGMADIERARQFAVSAEGSGAVGDRLRQSQDRSAAGASLPDELLGIGYLHKSEIANEVYRNPGERCLFPMAPAMKYAKTADSEKAVEHFLAFLKDRPDDL
jgi:hypothetical protein